MPYFRSPYQKITIFILATIGFFAFSPTTQAEFNPNFIISDQEIGDYNSWDKTMVQKFLTDRGSFLANHSTADASGTVKPISEIITDTASAYQINPKFILVTLQKEQSLVTDDNPTTKQLDWAAGYGVCDSCDMNDPQIQKYRGLGKQIDNAAGLLRWYYNNKDQSFVKKKDTAITIDNTMVTPQSWATAFLYTFTPHLHGNLNLWRIWQNWFGQNYPNGTLLHSVSSSEYWLIDSGKRRPFKNMASLITRTDPKLAINVEDDILNNYPTSSPILFPNYSILASPNTTYLLDYDTLHPFASAEVVRKLGYNPDEVIDVSEDDLKDYTRGATIFASSSAPQGVIIQITDLNNQYFLLKDDTLQPIVDKNVVQINFNQLKVERKKLKELSQYKLGGEITFRDGTLIYIPDLQKTYVVEKNHKRLIADDETFAILGYKKSNVISVAPEVALRIPSGEPVFINNSLLSAAHKFLGDNAGPIPDLVPNSTIPAYLVAEYPSGRIIAGKAIDTKRPIASLTKLVTAAEAVFSNLDGNKTTTYDTKKHNVYKNILGFVRGETLKNNDLFNAMLVGSVNTAAKMMPAAVNKTEKEFVTNANQLLSLWGATDTTIVEPTGLDEKNISTPRDLLKIFVRALEETKIKEALGKPLYTFSEVTTKKKPKQHGVKQSNSLTLKPKPYTIIASKTGYITEAGAHLIMVIEDIQTKKQYVILTMGDTNYNHRFDEPDRIARWTITQPSTDVQLSTLTH